MYRILAVALFAAAPLAAQSHRAPAPPAARGAAAPALRIPAAREFRHDETIVMAYHAPSGYGTVELRPMRVADAPALSLNLMYRFRGEHLAEPPRDVSIALLSASAHRYDDKTMLVFTLDDGSRVSIGPLFRQAEATADGPVERLALRINTAALLQVANASRVTGQLGPTAFALGGPQLEALRDFASRMDPAAHARALAAASATAERRGFTFKTDAYEPAAVDSQARPSALFAAPAYPAEIPAGERTRRLVYIEYVVDSTGRADPATLRARSPADSLFVRELRAVIERWTFTPATKDGRAVRQIFRQVFPFEP